jgi:uncharacterized membrane protein
MGSVAHYLEIHAPAQRCYDWWRPLTHLPEILPDVKSVQAENGDADITHWTVAAPAGRTVEWDARIIDEDPGHKVAWKSIERDEDKDNTVPNGGAVRFDDHGDSTGVEVSLQYDPPGGKLGEAAAVLFADPQAKVEAALESFKKLMEQDAR